MKNRLPIWDLVERAQAEVACRILESALPERQYALRKDAKEERSLLPERPQSENCDRLKACRLVRA